MIKRFYALILFLAVIAVPAFADDITITDADLQGNTTYNWTSDNVYILDGLVFLEDGGVLNIEAGTVIKGATSVTTGDNTSALIIARGAKIFATGAADAPIVFTAEVDDPNNGSDVPNPQQARGLWGGLIILGKATIARPGGEDGIEGIDADEPRARFGGGDSPVDDDDSGILRYVSIRHGGSALSPGNEINGLTLGGVGSGTTIEYIEVFANFDDGIEWFGGSVDVKYAAVSYCGDDSYDYDFGWRGRGQYFFSLNDDAPQSSGRAGEHDGASPDEQAPFSQPTIYNATYIGSGTGTAPGGDGNDYALVLRDNAGGFYWNSIFTDFNLRALTVEDLADTDVDSWGRFQAGDLAFKNNIWFGFGVGSELGDLFQLGESNPDADITPLVNQLVADGNTLDIDPDLGGISRTDDGGLDPRPNDGSGALGSAVVPTDNFFDVTTYQGAFSNSDNWLEGWTALSVNGFLGDLVTPATSQTIRITDADLEGNTTYNWTANNTYILDGLVFLEAGGVLNIEAGTVIKGATTVTTGDNTSALIITRDAQIFANGTADAPIVFTAEVDDPNNGSDVPNPQQARGLWGGVILLGNGIIARPGGEDGIEGIDADEERARFGGDNNDDNSGILRYVSIRHGGSALSPGNEINGLTLGGVGSGTTIEYIEVFANFDDGIEWFGGTVDVKYAAVSYCGDDSYDYDFGWRGRGQYFFSLNDDAPQSSGRAGEHDGASPDEQAPFAQPTIYNATYIGSGTGTAPGGDGNDYALVLRDNAGGFYWNSIFTDFNLRALTVEDLPDTDVDSWGRFQAGDLAFKNNLWFGFGVGSELGDLFQLGESNPDADVTPLVNQLVADENTLDIDPDLGGVSRADDGGLDPRPNGGSAALAGASIPADGFFDVTTFRGAFSNSNNWLEGWTALSVNGFLGDLATPAASSTIRITDADLVGGESYTWTANNTYVLDGLVFLEAGGVLNIEAGTVIKGATTVSTGDNTSALIITQGSQIFANGTVDAPIVFTAEVDDPNDGSDVPNPQQARGLWGGLIILGNATIARPGGEDGIEGIDADEERARFGGGDNPNDDDNSGLLRYVSIRHGGSALSPGNEINGLTLGGVGSGTTIEYVEVFANFDDGIEWFGGTVDIKYASVSYCGDDSYDYDFGWRGRGQFFFSLNDDAPQSSGRAGEHDGASPDEQAPFAQPTIYNATYIGSGAGTAPGGDGNDYALVLRDNAGGFYWNSIFTDFNLRALTVEDLPDTDVDSWGRFQAGDLAFKNNIWFGFGVGSELGDLFQLGESNPDADITPLVNQLVADGNTLDLDPALSGISRTDDGGLDPRPEGNSPALQDFAATPNDGFFENAPYKGAFPNEAGGLWLEGWTALSVNGFLGDLLTSNEFVKESEGFILEPIAPTPTSDFAQIRFTLPSSATVNMVIVDLSGRVVEQVVTRQQYVEGEFVENVNVANLPNGTYFVLLEAEGQRLTQKMIVLK